MKKVFGLVATLGLLAAGCASAAEPVTGFWYSDVKWGMQVPNGFGSKMGDAKCQSILGLVATGDASVESAAKAGGITKVMSVDHQAKSILGVWAEFTTHVTGE